MSAAVATVLCGAFLGASCLALVGAALLLRRARDAKARADRDIARSDGILRRSIALRDEGQRLRDEAEAIHRNCRAQPFSMPPPGLYRGLFGPLRAGVS